MATFVKQLGAKAFDFGEEGLHEDEVRFTTVDPAGGDMAEWPEDLRVREFPR